MVVVGMTRLSDGFGCFFVPPRQLHATVVVGGCLRTKIIKARNERKLEKRVYYSGDS